MAFYHRMSYFLFSVARKYSIDHHKLKSDVSKEFTRDRQDNLDPDGVYLKNTKHFDCFVKEHEIQEVNVGTVVLYLKGVKLAVSHQENLNLMNDLEDENERQNKKYYFYKISFVWNERLLCRLFIFVLKKKFCQ